jgi:hypothetical protein
MNKKLRLVAIAVAGLGLSLPLATHAELGLNSLTAQWWQWAFSIPNTPAEVVATPEGPEPFELVGSIHPLVGDDDDFGDPDLFEFCATGQHGEVWFLGGDFSGTGEFFERTCKVPAGKTILLPLINLACTTAEGAATPGDSVVQQSRDLKNCAEPVGDLLDGMAYFGPADGPLQKLKVKRLKTSRAFPVFYPPSNIAGLEIVDPNPSLAQADGQWIILRNLRPGRYRLEFTGVFDDPESPGIEFQIDGAYNLIVARPNGDLPE